MTKDEMRMWKNESLTSIRTIDLIPSAYFFVERGHNKVAVFLWLYKLTPIWFWRRFFGDIFDFYKQKMRNIAVDGMPLKWCKRNWYNAHGLSDKSKSFTVCVSFFCRAYLYYLKEDAGDSRLSLAKSREICCWQSSVTSKFSVNLLVTVDCK